MIYLYHLIIFIYTCTVVGANADQNLDPNSSLEVKVLYVIQLIVNQYHLFDQELAMSLTRILIKGLADVALAFSTLCDVMDRGPWYVI